MPRPPRALPVLCLLAAASAAGWFAGARLGVDPARLPVPRLAVGSVHAVASTGGPPALGALSAAALRDARFARHNGIPIRQRLDSGVVFEVPAGLRLRVLSEDMDLARVSPRNAPPDGLPREFWVAIEVLELRGGE